MDSFSTVASLGSLQTDFRARLEEQRLQDLEKAAKTSSPDKGDQAARKDACRKMEAYFLEQLMQSMQKTVDAWREKDDSATDIQLSMIWRGLSDKLAQAGGIGIARLMEEHLSRPEGTPALVGPDVPTPRNEGLLPPNSGANQGLGFSPVSPVAGRITSNFGWRVHPITGEQSFHRGVDLAVPKGTPVHTIGDGVVTWAGNRGHSGQTVIVRHNDGSESIYGHLEKIQVAEGSTISSGQVLGLSGNTGRSTGPHLHFEILSGGHAVDPARLISLG